MKDKSGAKSIFYILLAAICALMCFTSGCKTVGALSSEKDVSAHNSMNFPEWE